MNAPIDTLELFENSVFGPLAAILLTPKYSRVIHDTLVTADTASISSGVTQVTDADQCFASVLKGIHPLLKQNGFRKAGQNFVLESSECWGIINLQKSRWSGTDEKTFYVNVAVTAKRLLVFENQQRDKAPPHWKCVWNIRAEQLAPEPKMQQWTVRDDASVAEALEYLRILIGQYVIPRVKAMLTESDLLRMWADDASLGYPNLKAKSVLLAAQGNGVELEHTLRRLKEEFGTGVVTEGVTKHIAKLRREFPGPMERLHL